MESFKAILTPEIKVEIIDAAINMLKEGGASGMCTAIIKVMFEQYAGCKHGQMELTVHIWLEPYEHLRTSLDNYVYWFPLNDHTERYKILELMKTDGIL